PTTTPKRFGSALTACTNSTQTSNSNAWPKPCKSWPPRRHRETLKKASANRGDLRVKTMQPRVRSGVRIVRRRSDTRLQCFDPQQTLLRGDHGEMVLLGTMSQPPKGQ